MTMFAPGAKWVSLVPDIDAPEPVNDGIALARAPGVNRQDADI